MNNKELGEFISSENFKETSKILALKTEEIIGGGADIITTVFFGLPVYSLLKPFFDDIKNWKSRVELKQIAYFFLEYETLNQNERSEFSLMIQSNEEDFTEKLFYYVSQLNDKKKAKLCGKLGVAFARGRITSEQFLELVQKIKDITYADLLILKGFIEENSLFRRVSSDPKYEKTFFLSPLNYIFLIATDTQKISLKVNGFLTEQYEWKNLGNTYDIKKLEDVVSALRNQSPIYTLTESTYYLYKYGLMDRLPS